MAAGAQDRAWIERSDRQTTMVFDTLGAFYPEWMSSLGIEKFDTAVNDLKPGYVKRIVAALGAEVGRLEAARKGETDRRVRDDLDIIIEALGRNRRTNELEYRLRVDFQDLPRNLFTGLQVLLDERNTPERRQHALGRLRAYAGLESGTVPIAQLARDRVMERADAKLLWPYRGEVEQQLNNCERYLAGIKELFGASPVRGWEAPYEQLATQVRDYCGWVKSTVLPRARREPTLPRELYADRLVNVGVDISPEQAIALGTTVFAEVRDEMSMLAADIARERKLPSADYRDVLRALKRDVLPDDRLMPYYRERLADIERIIEREKLLTLPKRQAAIRLASEAESAAIPAPYLNVPRLIAWALTAHEARPGHELQFAAMVERGVSLARAVFASNSTNSEGWALYAESIVLPYFPPEGRLFGLQMRLMRAAREFLDPMVNLGRLSPEAAKEFLMREVTLSEPLAQQEADRYAFREPGQAVSYLYGYSRLRQLRMKAEIALREKFDQREFHDLIIEQGLLPPRLLETAVMAELTRRYPDKATVPVSGRSADSRSPRGAPAR